MGDTKIVSFLSIVKIYTSFLFIDVKEKKYEKINIVFVTQKSGTRRHKSFTAFALIAKEVHTRSGNFESRKFHRI